MAAGGGDQPPRRALRRDPHQGEPRRDGRRGGGGRAPRAGGAPDVPLEVECRTDEEVDEALAAGAPRLLLDNMSPARAAGDRGPRGRSRRARGQRRDRPGDDQGRRGDRGRLHIGRCAHALRPRPRPLTSPGAAAMNLPMAPLDAPPGPRARGRRPPCRTRSASSPRERDAVILAHNYQLPRGAGRRRLRRRLARPLAPGRRDRRRDDRLLRRALHGRDRVDPLAREDRPDPRPRRRLLAGRLDHAPSSCAPGRPSTRARSPSCTSTRRPRSRR